LVTYEKVGDLYESGNGVNKDREKASEYYKEGARRGNYYYHMAMAGFFALRNHEKKF
jgi:TPR repeat protein